MRIPDETEPAGAPGTATIAFALDSDGPATLSIIGSGAPGAAGAPPRVEIRINGRRSLNVATWNLLLDPAPSGARRPAPPG